MGDIHTSSFGLTLNLSCTSDPSMIHKWIIVGLPVTAKRSQKKVVYQDAIFDAFDIDQDNARLLFSFSGLRNPTNEISFNLVTGQWIPNNLVGTVHILESWVAQIDNDLM